MVQASLSVSIDANGASATCCWLPHAWASCCAACCFDISILALVCLTHPMHRMCLSRCGQVPDTGVVLDSVTQMALGAAIGEMVLGRRLGNKAMIVGAIVGSLPDLDVLIPFDGAVESFTYHRGFSHSLIVLTLLSPCIALLLQRLWRKPQLLFRQWWLMTWLALVTHPLLDGFTVYGTQLFWPVSNYPVSGSSVFIIDPIYTILLISGLLLASRRGINGAAWNMAGLILSAAYLSWSVMAKFMVEKAVLEALDRQAITHHRLLTTPMPFNTIGWRFVAMQDDGYLTGYYSLLDPDDNVLDTFSYHSDESLLSDIQDHWPVQRLKEFTHGFYKVQQAADEVQMVDLRMGIEGAYIFAFTVGQVTDSGVRPVKSLEAETSRDFSNAKLLMKRIFDPTVDLQR